MHKYLPKSDETFFGHLKLIRQCICSTRNPLPLIPKDGVCTTSNGTDPPTTSKGDNQPTTSKGEHTATEQHPSPTHGRRATSWSV